MGVEQSGAQAIIRTVPEVVTNIKEQTTPMVPDKGHIYATKKDVINCDGLALGSPTHFGNMASPLKFFIDSLTDVWIKGSLVNKPACVFTASSSMHGGQESTLISMMLPLLHLGMCIQGLPYTEPELHTTTTGGSPYGVSSVDNSSRDKQKNVNELSNEEIVLAIAMGKRLAENAIKLKQ